MELLSIDNKLVALNTDNMAIIDITDHIPKSSIRQIILDDIRLIILTTDAIHCCYYDEHDDEFVIEDITSLHTIFQIKFIANGFDNLSRDDFIVIFDDDAIIECSVGKSSYHVIRFANSDIVGVTDGVCPCLVARHTIDNCYNIKALVSVVDTTLVCKLDDLPDLFPTETATYADGLLTLYKNININPIKEEIDDVTHVTNKYYVKDNNVYSVYNNKLLLYGYENNNSRTVIIGPEYHVKLSKRFKLLTSTKEGKYTELDHVHYCVNVLGQYKNTSLGIVWSPHNHSHFDEYTSKFVRWVILCYKQSDSKRYFPKVVLYRIIQLVFCD